MYMNAPFCTVHYQILIFHLPTTVQNRSSVEANRFKKFLTSLLLCSQKPNTEASAEPDQSYIRGPL
jgi:hypothetical protein